MASQRVYWTNPKITDRRRWRKEYRAFMKAAGGAGSNASVIGHVMWHDDSVTERDNARLILADLAEEHGFAYLAMFLRTKMTCKKPQKIRNRK